MPRGNFPLSNRAKHGLALLRRRLRNVYFIQTIQKIYNALFPDVFPNVLGTVRLIGFKAIPQRGAVEVQANAAIFLEISYLRIHLPNSK